jgi:hypothetical protein
VSKKAEKKFAVSTESQHRTRVTLPPADTVRWVASRKTMVLAAIDAGSLSIEEACLRYRLSIEEIASWLRLTELHGSDGLKISRLGEYRKGEKISAGRSLSNASSYSR